MKPLRIAAVALAGAALLGPSLDGAGSGVRVRPGTVVRWPGAEIEACMLGDRSWAPLDGACYYPVDLLRREGALAVSRRRKGRRDTAAIQVTAYDYPVQKLQLPRSMVEFSPRDLERVKRENREIARLWTRTGPRQFTLPLQAPLEPLPEGGRFGSRRIINGAFRSPHAGADYTAAEGTPVLAAADGVVAMVADHFLGGHSVFLDHGDGLITLYLHLSRVDVVEGQGVRRGEALAAVGHTGRATGPHLHFGLRWHGARVDPALLLGDPRLIPAIE